MLFLGRLLLAFLFFITIPEAPFKPEAFDVSRVYAQTLSVYPSGAGGGKIMGFRGLDTLSPAPSLEDGRAIEATNVSLSSVFDIYKRYGYNTVNDRTLDDDDLDSPAITGLFDAKYSDGSNHTIVFLGNKIKYDKTGTWTTINTYPYSDSTAGQNYLWHCEMAYDYAVCTNDLDVPIKIDYNPVKTALDVSDLTDTLTKAKAVIWFRNYLILGNTVEDGKERPTRIRWTDVGTIETWDDDNYIDLSTFAGDEIIGFAELYGDVYIFMTKSIWKASLVGGDAILVLTKVIDGIGCVSQDSIQVVQVEDNKTGVMFLSRLKKVLLFNGVTVYDVGGRIQPTLDNLGEARLQYATSVYDGGHYYLSVSAGSSPTHDTLLVLNTDVFEWVKWTQIDANAMALIEESKSTYKVYFGNYDAFVYWINDENLMNDVDGAVGIVDSVGVTNLTAIITSGQVIIDADLTEGIYQGAILRITAGTAAGEEQVIITGLTTGIVVAQAFNTTPDSTSIYSIGDINANYKSKWFDFGNASTEKTYLGMLLWAEEASNNDVTVAHAVDFEDTLGSETVNLSPATGSLWDSAIWDESVWGTTGDKLYTVKSSGLGNFIQYQFSNDSIDSTFHIYGYEMIGQTVGIKQ